MTTHTLLLLAALGAWSTEPPVRAATGFSKLLNDLESHVPAGSGVGHASFYRDPNPVHSAHYMSHAANSYYRNRPGLPPRSQAVYVTGGNVFTFRPTSATLQQVEDSMPEAWKDTLHSQSFKTFQGTWNNQPLYLVDEAVAYMNSVKVGIEYENTTDTSFALMMAARYYRYMTALAPHVCDLELDAYVQWHRTELVKTIGYCQSAGVPTMRAQAVLDSTPHRLVLPALNSFRPTPAKTCIGGNCSTCP